MTGPTADGAVDPHQAMRDAQDRRFEREGIPMVLALFDERAPGRQLPAVVEESVLSQGGRFADTAGDFARTLFPQARDVDLAPSIVVLQAMAYSRFAPAEEPDPGPGAGPVAAPAGAGR